MGGEVLDTNQTNLPANSEQDLPPATTASFIQDIFNDPQKRLYAIIAGVLVVGLIIGAIFFFNKGSGDQNKGKPVVLVQELDQSRAFEIVAKLKSVNIDAKVNPSEKPGEYNITVYENAIETAYLALSRTNLLEDEGYGLFDQNDWAASDYDKRIKLSRAINGDLSRIISRMEGLRTAIVRVNIPEQEMFTDVKAVTTATVQIEMENDADELSKTQVKGIVNILRGYVPNLAKDQISIVDTQGRNYSSFKTEDDAEADDYIEEVERVNKSISKRIEGYLDDVLGHDRYKVSVSAKISREKIETQATKYSQGAVGARQTAKEEMNSTANAGNGKNYKQTNKNETLYPSFEQQNVTYLPGRVTDVSVALAVDKSVPATMSLKQLQESVAAIVGPSIPVENIKLTVVDLYTKEDQIIEAQKPKGFWTFLTQNSIWAWLGKIALGVAALFVVLVLLIVGLNVIGSGNRTKTETDPNLAKEYEELFPVGADEAYAYDDDFGEADAMAQQEALLKEMTKPAPNAAPNGQQTEFDNLLSGLQSTAQAQPDILAKKIQVWLDED